MSELEAVKEELEWRKAVVADLRILNDSIDSAHNLIWFVFFLFVLVFISFISFVIHTS